MTRLAAALRRLASWLAPEPTKAAPHRLHADKDAVALRAPVVARIAEPGAAVDMWPSVAIGFEWHDAPVRARGGPGGGVYL
jgi:hypothetical protein